MIVCSFEEEVDLPDGRFRRTKCIDKAEILVTNDPCFGLCFRCAYNKLVKRVKELGIENEQLKKWQIRPMEAICLTDLSCRYQKVFKND